MVLLDTVQLSELIQLGNQRVNHLHAFEQLCTALLVTPVLIAFGGGHLVLKVADLVLESANVSLLGLQLHNFLAQLVEKGILVSVGHSH